jgi:release factor glutamine methyltransferase
LRGRVNIIVANVPYVPTDSIKLLPQEARLYEPKLALDGGMDGLDFQRKVAEEALHWLAPGGHLLIETSEMQAAQTLEIFANAGLISKIARDEELDATVVIGTT